MRVLALLFIATSLLADSKNEKDLRAKVASLEASLQDAAREKTALITAADQRTLALHQEVARQASDIASYKQQVATLTSSTTVLQSQLKAQLQANEFQAKTASAAIKVIAAKPQPSARIDLSDLKAIRQKQIENSATSEERNRKLLQNTKKAADVAGATLEVVKSQSGAAEKIEHWTLINSIGLILFTLICDFAARIVYGGMTSKGLKKLAVLALEHKQGLTEINQAFHRMQNESTNGKV